jgi:hypothetical protein
MSKWQRMTPPERRAARRKSARARFGWEVSRIEIHETVSGPSTATSVALALLASTVMALLILVLELL